MKYNKPHNWEKWIMMRPARITNQGRTENWIMNEPKRNTLNPVNGSDEPQDCPNCPNQGWYAVQYTHADGTPDQCQQQCEWCYTMPNSKFNQNH